MAQRRTPLLAALIFCLLLTACAGTDANQPLRTGSEQVVDSRVTGAAQARSRTLDQHPRTRLERTRSEDEDGRRG